VFGFGRKTSDDWLDRFLLLKVVVAVNILIFILSAAVVTYTRDLPAAESVRLE
jgi:hypothetical protein